MRVYNIKKYTLRLERWLGRLRTLLFQSTRDWFPAHTWHITPVTLVPKNLMPSSSLWGHQKCTYILIGKTYRENENRQTNLLSKKNKLTVVCTYTIVLTLKQEENSDIYYISER